MNRSARANPFWGPDWSDLADRWTLNPEIAFLNHGSFGAAPHPVLDEQARLRNAMERDPILFLDRTFRSRLDAARHRIADFLGSRSDDLVLVPNATTGVNTVIRCLDFKPGDEILMVEHGYAAVIKTMRRLAEQTGATLRLVRLPLPESPDADLAGPILAAVTERTRLLVIDQITSPTALLLPIERLVRECRQRGILILVDGAHAPGMLPLNLTALDADFWTGNFHKWICAPKGSAGLWVHPQHQERIIPLVTSHWYGEGMQAEFHWTGTHDPTAYLATRAAIDFMGSLDWERIRAHNHALVIHGRNLIAEALGTMPPVHECFHGSMAIVRLPDSVHAETKEEAGAILRAIYEQLKVEVPVVPWDGRVYLRLSSQVYNCPEDYQRLAEGLPGLLKRLGF